jgi:hypothetical protein
VLAILGGLYALSRGFPAPDIRVGEQPIVPPPSAAPVTIDGAVKSPPPPKLLAGPAPQDAENVRKLEILKKVLASKNDNDPRLDSEFKNLSPAMKERLQQYYGELPKEQLNSRGTVAFLLGREAKPGKDAQFLASIVGENPCRSLNRCESDPVAHSADPDVSNDLTLAYPQVVALRGLLKNWAALANSAEKSEILSAVEAAAASNNPSLAREARNALSKMRP